VHNLIDELPRMQRMGVAVARISPQAQHTGEIVALFDAVRQGSLAPRDARTQLQPLMPEQSCNGYWHGRPGLDLVESEALAAA
jgi:Collagenase and related proteases